MSRHSMFWVRHNGQQDIRDNLTTLLADAGMTRAALCREADVPYGRLTAAMASNGWFYEADVEAIANVLDVSLDELRGGSLWRDQHDRYVEFDHRPGTDPNARTDDELEADNLARAICCECGTLRIVRAGFVGRAASLFRNDPGQPRLVERTTCKTCDAETKHAVLNNAEDRNADEDQNHQPNAAVRARLELAELVDRLAGFNVDVHFRSCGKKRREEGYVWSYKYDESKSRWRIEIDPNLPPRAQVLCINRLWSQIAVDEFDGIDWDPRETGVMGCAGSGTWESATDDLLDDIQRHLHVEKARLAQHVRDSLTEQEGAR